VARLQTPAVLRPAAAAAIIACRIRQVRAERGVGAGDLWRIVDLRIAAGVPLCRKIGTAAQDVEGGTEKAMRAL
jgi:hypothetical protein